MTGYTKLFGSILRSTVWRTPPHVRLVWITMLALSDRDGIVDSSVPGLADAAGVDRSQCEHALALFLAPDPDSRTPDYEGRRIEKVDGGWRLLNHGKYQDKLGLDDRRARDAERQKRCRDRRASRDKRDSHDPSRSVTLGHASHDMQLQHQTQHHTHLQSERDARAVPSRDVTVSHAAEADALHHAIDTGAAERNRRAIAAAYKAHTPAVPRRVASLAGRPEDTAAMAGMSEAALPGILARFFADRDMKAKGWPVGHLLANPSQWGETATGWKRDEGAPRVRPTEDEVPPWVQAERDMEASRG